MSKIVIFAFAVIATVASAADYPPPVEADFVITNFQFHSGQTLAAVRMHYLRFGNLKRDRNGVVRNAVLILHGTTGSSAQFLGPQFAGELFGPGQPLDVSRYCLIIPDDLGHGKKRNDEWRVTAEPEVRIPPRPEIRAGKR